MITNVSSWPAHFLTNSVSAPAGLPPFHDLELLENDPHKYWLYPFFQKAAAHNQPLLKTHAAT
jgi:hypothetical protein